MSTLAARRWARRAAFLVSAIDIEDMPAQFATGHNGGPALAAPLSGAALKAALAALTGDEVVRITFDGDQPDQECEAAATGTLMTVAGMTFVMVPRPGALTELAIGPLATLAVVSVEIVRSAEDVLAERRARWLGVPLLTEIPTTREGYMSAFDRLADAIVAEEIGCRRRRQLLRQMDELAETIALSKAKRLYLVTEAEHRRDGKGFDPARLANRFIRSSIDVPLPQDFDPDPEVRTNRGVRRALRMSNPVNAELAFMERRMRRSNLKVRRPPNADYLLIQIPLSSGKDGAFVYNLGKNLKQPHVGGGDPPSPTCLKRERRAMKTPEYHALMKLLAERTAELKPLPVPAVAPIAVTQALASYIPPVQLKLF